METKLDNILFKLEMASRGAVCVILAALTAFPQLMAG